MTTNFTKIVLDNEGILKPLLLPANTIKLPSLCNPSILVYKNELLVNIRNTNYILYHSEKGKNEHIWGPLVYIHPENDNTLTTYNILCKLDKQLNIINQYYIDTSSLDKDPLWEFIGLEDGRLVYWEEKLFLCGVRRDTTTNGVGRMELSEINLTNNEAIEHNRIRIPTPGSDETYCEKNWMPILDQKYSFIKWTNPTEIAVYDSLNNTISSNIKAFKKFDTGDLRGGSQVLNINNHYVAVVHETVLYNSEAGRKNAEYYHRFIVWDKDFNIKKISDKFKFMNSKIEFCCGFCEYEDNFYITFGFQDNAAFILSIPKKILLNILNI